MYDSVDYDRSTVPDIGFSTKKTSAQSSDG